MTKNNGHQLPDHSSGDNCSERQNGRSYIKGKNQTQVDFPMDAAVHQLFQQQAATTPDRVALVFNDQQLTYAELDRRSELLAYRLQEMGVTDGSFVAMCMDRALEIVVAMLGVLKAGGAFVPLDPSYPAERLAFMLEDVAAPVVITQTHFQHQLPKHHAQILFLDAGWGSETHERPSPIKSNANGASPAYIMYTSGSTGRPKGVVIPHRGISRLVLGSAFTPLDAERVLLQLAPVSFDASTLEIWGALLHGARCVLYPKAGMPDPFELGEILAKHQVTTLWLTASLFNAIISNAPQVLRSVKEILTGGEALSLPHIQAAQAKLPNIQLINGYGPTESTTFTCCYRIPTDLSDIPLPEGETLRSIPIGRPIANTQTYILDENMRPVPEGSFGELYIGGYGLALGYHNLPEKTAERFVPNPFSDHSDDRLYKTGDKVRYLPTGLIDFSGRLDDQIKLRGFRIELGEITTALISSDLVGDGVVILREDTPGDKRLVAYVTAAEGQSPTSQALYAELSQSLPQFMIPDAFVIVPKIPLNPNGKADRRALPAPIYARKSSEQFVAAADEVESKLAQLWAEVLNLDQVGVNDNFFDLGGNSISTVKVVTGIRSLFDVELPIVKIFEFSTVRSLAAYIRGDQPAGDDYADVKERARQARAGAGDRTQAIAVIGMSGRFPGADNVDELWQLLADEQESTTFFDRDELSPWVTDQEKQDKNYVRARGILNDIDKFDAAFFDVNPREAEVMDPQHRVFLELAYAALEDAGYAPDLYDGLIGLYAGMGENTYRRVHVDSRPELTRRIGDFQVMLGNEKDYVVTRTAYKLNLTGPSMSITTACSTSLVAVAQAFHSLLTGQCDIALAGGISIKTPQNIGYQYQEGGMLSSDGRCRPFDSEAEGTMFNNGAGIVVLKRLDDALADGDHIEGVILGVGVNNDGGGKVSFTAPSVDGQARAIATALATADISPETISYVEAHGTATPLGDPIEVEALTKAYRAFTDAKAFCGIGSIKSNVGHLVSAAGVAGLMKTMMAMQHATLPASLNYSQPNPNINFADSPFYVVDTTRPWVSDTGLPRRAGVSSFGVGGTNAHVIVQEAPALAETSQSRPWQLLLLSAKTDDALAEMTGRLKRHLESNPDADLADVAYTLKLGRQRLSHKRIVVAQNGPDAIEALQSLAPDRTARKIGEPQKPPVAFIFPGQGDQYINMGAELYAGEPIFRDAVDRCADLLTPLLGRDLRELLYPADESQQSADDATAMLQDTYYTQPAIFTVSYALAKLWMSWGVMPQAMVGHSIGEFVAACLAGVFTLEDALRLIANRGRLMRDLPTGSMLSVRLSGEETRTYLTDGVEVAAENGPQLCVIAGPESRVRHVRQQLEAAGVVCRPLRTSHAFHSPMMDPIIEPFAEITRGISLSAPQTPVVSTVTGRWMTIDEATDPNYWANHLRAPVLYSGAIRALWENPDMVLLECGPRATMGTLARKQAADLKRQTVISSLSGKSRDDWRAILMAAGRLCMAGYELDWQLFYENESRRRVSLPTYPFARTRYWIDPLSAAERNTLSSAPQQANQTSTNHSFGENAMTHNVSATVVPRKDRLVPLLKQILEDISGLDVADAEPDVTFLEMGFDSLFLTQASLAIKNEFQVDLSFRQMLEEYPTFDLLAQYLDGEMEPNMLPASAEPSLPTLLTAAQISGSAALAPIDASGGSLAEKLIAQQLQIMQQQLAVLQGQPAVVSSAPPATAPPPVTQPSTPAASKPAAKKPAEKAKEMKPFGAIARINKKSNDGMTDQQAAFLKQFIADYNARTIKSKEFTTEHRPHMADPRVVTGFKPQIKELIYPIVMQRSKGSHMWDLDGNEYVDALNGFGSNFMGYNHPAVAKAVAEQVELGYEIGPQQMLTGEAAKLLCEMTGMDRAAFCNTGSEAVLGTMRMARTITGRKTVAIFAGSYHGIFDEVLVRGTRNLRTIAAAPGVMTDAVQNILVLDYGTDEALEIIKERRNELAAVLVEPIQSRRPDFQPREFLHQLRDITADSGTALIFDEVITGFRMGPGGAQEHFGVTADLAAYGKVIGGGMPIGVMAGCNRFMDALDGGQWQFGDDSVPEIGVTYFAGTFVRHPLAIAACKAVLDFLNEGGRAVQDEVNDRTERLVSELDSYFKLMQAPLQVKHFSSLFRVTYTDPIPYGEIFFYLIRQHGVHIYDGFPCFLTVMHTDEDVDKILDAFKSAVRNMQAAGFFPVPELAGKAEMMMPPVNGARLGRDAEGNPAWFVDDPENPGQYMKVEAQVG